MKRDFFKQKVILFFGYNGKNYHGLQNQKGSDVLTVESKLYQALFDSNLVGKATFGELHQTGWSRGARTDKGVHALCNSVSMKLWISKEFLLQDRLTPQLAIKQLEQNEQVQQEEDKNKFDKNFDKYNIDFKKITNLINSNLPQDMRLYTCKLVTQSFDVRKSARCRLYEYILPVCVYQTYDQLKSGAVLTEEWIQTVFERIRGVVKKFQGTHNFHNYSRGLRAKDATATRYIMSMDVERLEHKGVQFFRFKLLGQSFVYHQIRKMIGMTIQLYYEELPDTFIDNTFFSNQIRVLLAPAEGLFLNRIFFDGYNKKPDVPAQLTFSTDEEKLIQGFRPTIEEHIFNQEIQDKVFSNWLIATKEKNNIIQEESDNGGDD